MSATVFTSDSITRIKSQKYPVSTKSDLSGYAPTPSDGVNL